MKYENPEYRYPVGIRFIPRGKKKAVHTVVDYATTYNRVGQIIRQRYITLHDLRGIEIMDTDMLETTIAMGTAVE